ncbi:hypothetical protein Q3G72_023602 [Acer saccharum]|nr:hypothetical protein Q3G72_023602 [Acer saccharum]
MMFSVRDMAELSPYTETFQKLFLMRTKKCLKEYDETQAPDTLARTKCGYELIDPSQIKPKAKKPSISKERKPRAKKSKVSTSTGYQPIVSTQEYSDHDDNENFRSQSEYSSDSATSYQTEDSERSEECEQCSSSSEEVESIIQEDCTDIVQLQEDVFADIAILVSIYLDTFLMIFPVSMTQVVRPCLQDQESSRQKSGKMDHQMYSEQTYVKEQSKYEAKV